MPCPVRALVFTGVRSIDGLVFAGDEGVDARSIRSDLGMWAVE